MSARGKRVIYAGAADGGSGSPLLVEGVVIDPGIDPGSLVEIKSDGTGIQRDTRGSGIFGIPLTIAGTNQAQSTSVDVDWIVGENMVVILPRSGEFINVFSGDGIRKGHPLARANFNGPISGLKVAVTTGMNLVVAYADEDQGEVFPGSAVLLRVRIA